MLLSTGKAKYDAKKHALVWKIKRFDGQWEHTLSANVERLATTRDKKAWGHPPISMSFQVSFHTSTMTAKVGLYSSILGWQDSPFLVVNVVQDSHMRTISHQRLNRVICRYQCSAPRA